MKKTVKTLTILALSLCLFKNVSAQLRLPTINGVANDVKKVIEDYPNGFVNLMGEVVSANTQSTDYQCTLKINGAEESTVTRYSAKKEICSWQAVMLTTEDFEKAKKEFRSLYNQLNNLSVNSNGKGFRLKGNYEVPSDAMKFTSVLFSCEPSPDTVQKLKVEVAMQFTAPMEWKVKLLVYDREREDKERGKQTEE